MEIIKSNIASLGNIKGYTIKIKDPFKYYDFDFNKKPYILVCHHTNPDFMPIIYQIKGAIGEVGSVCSHLGIVARELGIPALIGPINIFNILSDNQYIELDAINGLIKIL